MMAIHQLDWKNKNDYEFTRQLNSAQWAWEFLRRNIEYQEEWSDFIQVWQLLESRYGKAPNRNFTLWKADPLAWVHQRDCEAGDCRVDEDKVLIECALGARWGFYKFPVNPNENDPIGNNKLNWRPIDEDIEVLGQDDKAYLGEQVNLLALGFDLSLPLAEQLERAKRQLQIEQRLRIKNNSVQRLSVKTKGDEWAQCLRWLDGLATGIEVDAVTTQLDLDEGIKSKAAELLAGGYRQITLIPG